MAKTKKAKIVAEEAGGNIPGLAALKKEFQMNKMPPKKVHALKEKLRELTDKETATEDEWQFLETILRKQRSHNLQKRANIEDKDKFWINAREASRLEEKCIVKSSSVPLVLKMPEGLECKFEYDSDNLKYIVYSPEIIAPEMQIKISTRRKEDKGHPIDPSEYPAPKEIIHRHVLPEKEFHAWFDVMEDLLADQDESEDEEVYTF